MCSRISFFINQKTFAIITVERLYMLHKSKNNNFMHEFEVVQIGMTIYFLP